MRSSTTLLLRGRTDVSRKLAEFCPLVDLKGVNRRKVTGERKKENGRWVVDV